MDAHVRTQHAKKRQSLCMCPTLDEAWPCMHVLLHVKTGAKCPDPYQGPSYTHPHGHQVPAPSSTADRRRRPPTLLTQRTAVVTVSSIQRAEVHRLCVQRQLA